jgi:hypothetical protein
MSDIKPESHQNVYLQNVVTGVTSNPVMQNPDAIDEEFIEAANRVLNNAIYSFVFDDKSQPTNGGYFFD